MTTITPAPALPSAGTVRVALLTRLRTWWRDRPIGVKLRLSLLSVLLVTFAIVLTFTQSTFNNLALKNYVQSQSSETSVVVQNIHRTLGSYNADALAINQQITTDQSLVDYLQSLNGNLADGGQTPALQKVLASDFNLQLSIRPNIRSLRFSLPNGRQAVYILHDPTSGLLINQTAVQSGTDATLPGFANLASLPIQPYFVSIQPRPPSGTSASNSLANTGLTYLIAVPYRHGTQYQGSLLVEFDAPNVIEDFFGSPINGVLYAVRDSANEELIASAAPNYVYNGAITTLIPDSGVLPFPSNQRAALLNSPAGITLTSPQQITTYGLIPITTINGPVFWEVLVSQDPDLSNSALSSVPLPIVFVFILLVLVTLFIEQFVTRPLRRLATATQRLQSGDFNTPIPHEGRDEIGQLGDALNTMATQVSGLLGQMESRVIARTRDVEVVAEISRNAASSREIDTVLSRVVDQLRDRFNFYHVQIFLVDNAGEFAVLHSSTGDAGKALLARQHRLRIGGESIVGKATGTGEARITQNTNRGDVSYYPNPLLPDTRSELALPIRSARAVLGALDVQSTQENAFNDDDIRIFQVLADQLAVTIQNARLLDANQYEAQRARTLLAESTQNSWREFLTEQPAQSLGFRYDMLNVRPIAAIDGNGAADDGQPKTTTGRLNSMRAPIAVRGTPVGELTAVGNEGESLSVDDRKLLEDVAERVALAIDNVRLNQKSQIARGEVERLYEINRQLTSAATVEEVFRLIADQMGQEFFVDALNIISVDPVGSITPQTFTPVLGWNRERGLITSTRQQAAMRIPARNLPFIHLDQPEQPYDVPLSDLPEALAAQAGVTDDLKSMIVVPITIGRRWFGALGILSRQPNAFPQRFRSFLTALSDQAAVAVENRSLFEQAEAGRATLQSVLEALPVGILVIDIATRQIVLFNTRALDYLDQPVTRPTLDIDTVREYMPMLDLVLGGITAQILTFQRPERQPDEQVNERSIGLQSSEVRDSSGNVISLIVAISDVTELRQAQKSIETELLVSSEISEFERMIAGQADLPALMNAVGVQLYRLQPIKVLYFIWQNEKQSGLEIYQWQSGQAVQPLTIGYDRQLPFPAQSLTETYGQNLYNVNLIEPKMQVARLTSYPLTSGGRFIGWLLIGSPEVNPTAEYEHLFRTVLDRLALLAESLRLQQQTEVALRETARLYLASRAISNSLNSVDTAFALAEQLRALNPNRIDIFLIDAHNEEYAHWVEHWIKPGEPEVNTDAYTLPVESLSSPAIVISDTRQIAEVEHITLAGLPEMTHYRAIIEQPIQVKMTPIGRLSMAFDVPRGFSPDDLRFIETLCEQAATVIDNALLYRESQQSLEEASTLYQAGRIIVNIAHDSDILSEISEYAFPPGITRAMLFRFLTTGDHAMEGTLLIASDWSRDAEEENLGGRMYLPTESALYNLLNIPDLYYIEDVANNTNLDEETRQLCLSLNMASFVVIPLSVAGRSIGAMIVAANTLYEFGGRELQLYASLADQAAVALDNRALLRQTEARSRQIQTTLDVGRATTSILNLNELLQQTVYLIKDSFGYDHVQIFLINPDGKQAQLQASTGEAGRQLLSIKHSLTVGSTSVIGRVTSSGKLYNVEDTQDPRSTHRPNPYLPQTRSELALPLIARGKVIGALDVQSNIARAFAPDDEQILSTLSDQLAVAIDNAALFGQNEQRISESRFLFNATRAAMTAETDIAFSRVTRQILENTPSDLVVLFTSESSEPRWDLTYAAREGVRYVLPSGVPSEMGLLGELGRNRQPIIVEDKGAGKLFSADDVPDVRALVLFPLSTGDNLLGALAIFSAQPDVYTPELVQLLQTLVSSLSAIVQNTRLVSELQVANVQLVQVDSIKTQFLANMSHELRTPLNSIIGFSRVILKGLDGPLNEIQTQDLNTVFESGKHLLNLVNAILDQAKIEAGKMEVDIVGFDVNTSIKTAMSTAIGLVKDKPIRLHQEVQADLPEVYGDETRLTQVLLNMLSNAAKFTRQGSITLSAFTTVENGHKVVQISVADTGIGIPSDSLDRVFAAFEQVDNSVTRGAEGTGLGMPIARALIEMMGGRIWVESTVGAGSTFSIVLPTEPPDQSAEENEQTTEPDSTPLSAELAEQVEQALSAAKDPDFEHQIIIALDDEPGMFNLFRRYLTKSGYEVIGTTKPDELVELVVTYQPRAVLLDINMPNHSGWDILQMLKSRPETYNYPVVMCSIEDDKLRGHRLGASGYLVKPFLEEELFDVLKRIELEREWPLVLIIDDQSESLRLTRDTLQLPDLNIRILEATDGDQGIAMIASQRPAVVILDLRMPDPDGFAVIEKLRADPSTAELPVLLVTASDLSEAERSVLNKERVEYKGNLSGDDLVRYVREQLARSE